MKKLILLLLISGGLSAQVVIPKSTTTFSNVSATGTLKVASTSTLVGKVRIGALTVPSATLDVTGTMSVSGTSTLTGAVTCSSTISSASTVNGTGFLVNGSTALNSSNGSRVTLAASGAYTSCEVTSGKPLILDNASLTGGNTGTVAVLSDAVFPVQFMQHNMSPADGATYYITGQAYNATIASDIGRMLLPYNCTLVGWSYSCLNNGVNGSAETSTLSINGSTNYTMSTTITHSASATYTATGLSQSFSAGDMINIKWICPTWATNPTSCYIGITLWFVRRQ